MARPILDEAQIHPAVRERVAGHHQAIVSEVRDAVARHPVVVVGMRQNPFPRKARKLLTDAGIAYQYLEYGSYFSQWRERNGAEDVERLADAADDLHQGRADRRRRRPGPPAGQRRLAAAAGLTAPAVPSVRVSRWLVGLLALPCALAGGGGGRRPAAALPPGWRGAPGAVRHLQRPLDPAAPGGRRSTCTTRCCRRWRATSAPDPVFFFAGGPGQSAIAGRPGGPPAGALQNRRDIVLIDQRGTGRSAPLVCDDDEAPRRPLRETADPAVVLQALRAAARRCSAAAR
jgi:hypothetical protein